MSVPDRAGGVSAAKRNLILTSAMMIFGGIIWGGTFSLAKLVTEAGVHPFGVALMSGVIGALILLPYSVMRRGGIPLGRDYIAVYFIAGILGTALPSSVLFLSAARMPAGILAIIVSLVPLMTYAIALMLGVERWRRLRAAGIGLGFAAILMIVVPDSGLPDPSMAPWALFALIAPLAYAGESVYIAIRRPPGSNPFALLCGMLSAGSLILLPLVWATDAWVPLDVIWTLSLWWILALAVINVIAYVLFLELIRLAGPLFAAQMGYVVTASGVVWGMVIFGEVHSPWIWAALAVLFTGIAVVHPRKVADDC